MIRHVVLWRFRPGLSAERKESFHVAVSALPAQIPAIDRMVCGPALGLQPGDIDYVLVLDFEDPGAFRKYKDHDAHRRLIDDQVNECVAVTVRAQLEI